MHSLFGRLERVDRTFNHGNNKIVPCEEKLAEPKQTE